MGFIRAALSAGLNSFNDSKFKEAVVLPDHVSSDVMASGSASYKRSRR